MEGCLNDNGMLTVICVRLRAKERGESNKKGEREIRAVSFGDHKKGKGLAEMRVGRRRTGEVVHVNH